VGEKGQGQKETVTTMHNRKHPTSIILFAFILCVVVETPFLWSSIVPQDNSSQLQEKMTNGSLPSSGEQSKQDVDEITSLTVPAYTKVYVAPMPDGFENYIISGLQTKKVHVSVVLDRDKAAYEISGVSQSKNHIGIKVSNSKTGVVILGYSVDTTNPLVAGEEISKHLQARDAKGSLASDKVPKTAKIFVPQMTDGFDISLKHAIEDSIEAVQIVQNRDLAEFEITGTFETHKFSTLATIPGGRGRPVEAAVRMSNIKNSEVVWSFVFNGELMFPFSRHPEKYIAEWCARALKREAIEK
jgi:hypothetical protein